MSTRTYLVTASAIFLVVGLTHLLKIISGFEIKIFGEQYPLWLSWTEMLVAFFLSYTGFKLARKS